MKKIEKSQYKTVLLFHNIAKNLKPRPVLLVSDWADTYRQLSPEASAEPGRWNTSRAEFQREIMNAVNDPDIQDVVIMSSAQVGKTEIVLNICGYYMDYDPTSILVLQPTIEMGETFSKDRLAPMIRDTPVLTGKIKEPRAKGSDNTILHKKFPGGHITIAGANSPASLASRPIRVVLCDEVDRYPDSAGTEGDPVKLAEKRTTTYWNRKKIKVSTPTIAGISKIEKEFNSGTKEEWCVKCPCCGKFQPYQWNRIQFKTVSMECLYCKEDIGERDWKESEHKWIASNEDVKGKRSFHLNELCSPWKSWKEIINDFREANEDYKKTGSIEALKVFRNTSLGEVWEERGDGADEQDLLKRREQYEADIPDGALVLTAGVDVQDDRLEIEICGWAREYESWGIFKKEIRSNPALESTWDKLEEEIETEYYFNNGHGLLIAATCIDTGGHHTNMVYKFVKRMHKMGKNVFGIKGYSNVTGIPLIYKKTKVDIKNSHGTVVDHTDIYILGVDSGKEDIISRLNIKEPGSGYCHFPKNMDRGYNQMYMKGLTSEEKVTKRDKKNRLKIMWVKKPGIRNEPLDLRNYAYAAVELIRPNWNVLEEKIENGINYMKKDAAKRKKRKHGVVNKGVQI
ncbi:phage terminase, large subunit [Lachnospiraceae bacterium KM106-2]|nr:phage terminase, large subunit [Lachnospiraceae bacterium KM106-2]